MNTANTLIVPLAIQSNGTLTLGETIVSGIAGLLAVLFALFMLISRRAVYSAMSLIGVMLCLAVIYTTQSAPFLGAVQVVVYTGAVMMLILFVLMLVGIDASDSRHETLKGQRLVAVFSGITLALGLIVVAATSVSAISTLIADQNTSISEAEVSNPVSLAVNLLSEHTFTLELVGTLLIIAAVGAMTLTHRQRLEKREDQIQRAARKMSEYAKTGQGISMLPPPGVFAESNSAANPAIGPGDKPVEAAVPRVLLIRGQAKTLPEASPSTALRLISEESSNSRVTQGGLAGMPGKPAPIPADPTAGRKLTETIPNKNSENLEEQQ